MVTGELKLSLLGQSSLIFDDQVEALALQRPTALLIYLAYYGSWLSREELAFLFYAEDSDREALKKLRVQLHRAKNVPWSHGLETSAQHLRWHVNSDVASFFQHIEHGQYAHAFKLYSGDLLQGQSLKKAPRFNDWLEFERRRLQQAWLEAGRNYSQELAQAQSFDQSMQVLERLLEADPLNEAMLEQSLRLGQETGQQQRALRVFYNFERTLAAELGLVPSHHTQTLVRSLQEDQQLPEPQSRPLKRLPIALGPFVGRELEIAEVIHHLEDQHSRLLTIIGQGGSGKTRLALELGVVLAPRFKDGLAFVALAPVTHSHDMLSAIASTLGLQGSASGKPEQDIENFLREKHYLLILDNVEQLLAEGQYLINLLSHCPQLVILATSRERLKLSSEQIISLAGLPYDSELSDAERLITLHAQQLGVHLNEQDQPPLRRLCKRLEGLPLALALAVPWLRVMSVQALETDLSQSFQLLESGDKHLRAVFETSWQRLSRVEQEALCQLTVFHGGFSREAAETVTHVHLPLLLSLVDKSLLTYQQRFGFHNVVYYYAAEKLEQRSRQDLEKRHASYFAQLLADSEASLRNEQQLATLNLLDQDQSNIKAFWQWASENNEEGLLNQALGALVDSLTLKSAFVESNELLAQTAALISSEGLLYQRVQARRGRTLMRLGRYEQATALLKPSLAYFEHHHLPAEAASCYLSSGTVARNQGELATALTLYHQALVAAKSSQDRWQEALALNNIGIVLYRQGLADAAKQHYQQSLALLEHIGAQWATALPRNNLALIALTEDNPEAAEIYLQHNLDLFQTIGDRKGQALSLSNLGSMASKQKKFNDAKAFFEQSLTLARDIGEQWAIANDLVNLAFVRLELAEFSQASRDLQEATRYSQRINVEPMLIYALVAFGLLLSKEQQPRRAAEILCFCQQQAAANAYTRERAAQLITSLALPDSVMAKARERASTLNLSELVVELSDYNS